MKLVPDIGFCVPDIGFWVTNIGFGCNLFYFLGVDSKLSNDLYFPLFASGFAFRPRLESCVIDEDGSEESTDLNFLRFARVIPRSDLFRSSTPFWPDENASTSTSFLRPVDAVASLVYSPLNTDFLKTSTCLNRGVFN